jgi:hypothetical protein
VADQPGVKCAAAILLIPPGYGRGGNICDEYRQAGCKQRAEGKYARSACSKF